MWQRFTDRARKAVFYAQEEAQTAGAMLVQAEHILIGVLRQPTSTGCRILERSAVTPSVMMADLRAALGSYSMTTVEVNLGPTAKRLMDLCRHEARELGCDYVGTEHLLLAAVRLDSGLQGLGKYRLDLDELRIVARTILQGMRPEDVGPSIEHRNAIKQEELLCMLSGGGWQQHMMISLLDRRTRNLSATRPEVDDPRQLCHELFQQIRRRSAEGLATQKAPSLSNLLARASEVADGNPPDSRHLLLALLESGEPEVIQAARGAGLTADAVREGMP